MSRGNPPIKNPSDPIDPLRYYPILHIWTDLQGLSFKQHYRAYQRWIQSQVAGKNKYRIKVIDGVRKHKYLNRPRFCILFKNYILNYNQINQSA